MDEPCLIEPSVKNYLFNTLHKCHSTRINIYYYALNIIVLVTFAIFVGLTLYYCYTQKPSEYDRQQKMLSDQEYVLNKIRFYQDQRKNDHETQYSSISNLPFTSG
jgi:hypothetical protein